jgi:hypothetical protein
MAEGVMSYEGLAVPLFGECEIKQQDITKDILTLTSYESNTAGDFIVCQDSDGTELFQVQDDGRVRITRTGVFSEALNAWYYCNADITAGTQQYGAAFLFDELEFSMSGGRNAVLNLRYNSYVSGNHADRSFINFNDEGEKGTALFTILSGAVDGGGCMETNTCDTATHGIVIYSNNVKYWIMCSDISDN